jgi:predicted dehydrogenase
MAPKLRCIVLGCGHIALHMLDHLTTFPWFEAAALVDLNPVALDQAQARFKGEPAPCFQDFNTALSTVQADTVLINTPAEIHTGQTRLALTAGKHVLVAKPFCENYQSAAELVDLAETQGVSLAVAEQMRYTHHYRALKAFLDKEALGAVEVVHYLNSKPRHQVQNLKTMRQPAVLEMSCHHFDIFAAIFPDRVPEQIFLDGFQPSWSVYAGPCMLNGVIRFSGNLRLLYHAGYSSQAACYEFRLEGTRGALRCRGLHMSLPEMHYEFALRGGPFQPIQLEEEIPQLDPWTHFCLLWYEGVIHKTEQPFSGRNNLKIMALMDAGIASIESGLPCRVKDHPLYSPAFASGTEWRVRR